MRSVAVVLLAGLVLTSCGTRLNPLNWFGRSSEVVSTPATDAKPANALIPARRASALARPKQVYAGIAIDEITDLRIERTTSGAIIHATGIAARQGAFDARLTPETEDESPVDGVLTYTFDVVYPNQTTALGSPRSREVSVARSLSFGDLEAVRVIRVIGSRNTRESRRR